MTEDSSRDESDSTDTRIAALEGEVERLEARVEKQSKRIIDIWTFLIGIPLLLLVLGALWDQKSVLVLVISAVTVFALFLVKIS